MKTIWNEGARHDIVRRIRSVRDEMKPRWGKMSSAAMLCHLEQSLRMHLGHLPVKSKRLPLRYFPLKQLVVYLLPVPKGTPTAPELIAAGGPPCDNTAPGIERLLDEFAQTKDTTSWPEHPAFGRLSRSAHGRLLWKHIDHHLRQFGV
jgi:hypothetical protein